MATLVDTLDQLRPGRVSQPWRRSGAHAFWRAHCRYLLALAGAPDPDVRAEVLLAALAAEQVRFWRDTAQRPLDELGAALSRLAHALAAQDLPDAAVRVGDRPGPGRSGTA